MPIELRPIDFLKDINPIVELEDATFDLEAFDFEDFVYFWQISTGTFWVAYDGKQLAGYVVANIKGDEGYIASIAVDADYRKRGLGQRLMLKVIDIIKADETATHIRLHVRERNVAAIGLYQKLGFEIEASEADYYPEGEAAYRMMYRLQRDT